MKYSWFLFLFPLISLGQSTNFTLQEAEKLLSLPLHCIETEFPNKLNQVLADPEELGTPEELHPIFMVVSIGIPPCMAIGL